MSCRHPVAAPVSFRFGRAMRRHVCQFVIEPAPLAQRFGGGFAVGGFAGVDVPGVDRIRKGLWRLLCRDRTPRASTGLLPTKAMLPWTGSLRLVRCLSAGLPICISGSHSAGRHFYLSRARRRALYRTCGYPHPYGCRPMVATVLTIAVIATAASLSPHGQATCPSAPRRRIAGAESAGIRSA